MHMQSFECHESLAVWCFGYTPRIPSGLTATLLYN
jgi:hypothetical protein